MNLIGNSTFRGAVAFTFVLLFPFGASAAPAGKTNSVPVPIHDPSDQLFRLAPMTVATRSIIVPLATNLHLAFDAERLRTHTVWAGKSLNMYGPPYHGSSDRFMCDFDGPPLWTTPQVFPWSVGNIPENDVSERPAEARFLGISTKDGYTELRYEISGGDVITPVQEVASAVVVDGEQAVKRIFNVAPHKRDLFLLVHAERGEVAKSSAGLATVKRADGKYLTVVADGAKLVAQKKAVNYSERLFTELNGRGPRIEAKTNRISGFEARVYLKIPARSTPAKVEIVSAVVANEKDAARVAKAATKLPSSLSPTTIYKPEGEVAADKTVFPRIEGDKYYKLEHFPIPKGVDLRVTGMDFLPNGDLVVCSWGGDIYFIRNAQSDVRSATYKRFARGLMEPLGLKIHNGQMFVVQKGELTRISDTDGNGEADLFETINAGWGFNGRYNAFAMGPVIDKAGNFYTFLGGNGALWDVPYMGWAVKISPDGRNLDPFCSGLRVPHGFAIFGPDEDIFMAENQGNWIGACKLNHLQRGKFYGHPSSWPAPKEQFDDPKEFAPPAVWFPYTLAKSASGISIISDDRFGPFKGQMMVADFQNSVMTRVMLEKVNGQWQGAVWPFAKGFGSGVNRAVFGPDAKLYVGGGKGGHWSGAVGAQMQSLDRLSFTGKVPFAIQEVHATSDGFDLVFSKPVDASLAAGPDGYMVTQHTYKYHGKYGSPEIDHEGKENSSTEIKVINAKVSPDALSVRLTLQGHKAGYVTMVRADLSSDDGDSLWHDTFWYTLNNIPKP